MTFTEQFDGKTYRVSNRERLISITGPLENKKPHRALWSKTRSEWVKDYGLAGFEGHSGPRVTAFYRAANALLNRMGVG